MKVNLSEPCFTGRIDQHSASFEHAAGALQEFLFCDHNIGSCHASILINDSAFEFHVTTARNLCGRKAQMRQTGDRGFFVPFTSVLSYQ